MWGEERSLWRKVGIWDLKRAKRDSGRSKNCARAFPNWGRRPLPMPTRREGFSDGRVERGGCWREEEGGGAFRELGGRAPPKANRGGRFSGGGVCACPLVWSWWARARPLEKTPCPRPTRPPTRLGLGGGAEDPSKE